MLLGAIKSNAQSKIDSIYIDTIASPRPVYEMARPAEDVSKFYSYKVARLIVQPFFRIDSAYLQLIITELERHGYTLVKLPKKN